MRYTVMKAFRPRGSGSPEATVGSELELTESQARVFKALAWVKEAEAKAAEPVQPPQPPEDAGRTYMRRDMTAETEAAPAPVRRAAAKKTARTHTHPTVE